MKWKTVEWIGSGLYATTNRAAGHDVLSVDDGILWRQWELDGMVILLPPVSSGEGWVARPLSCILVWRMRNTVGCGVQAMGPVMHLAGVKLLQLTKAG
jgi:hypothetical protein